MEVFTKEINQILKTTQGKLENFEASKFFKNLIGLGKTNGDNIIMKTWSELSNPKEFIERFRTLDLVRAILRFKEDVYELFGIATRQDLETLHKRLDDLEKKLDKVIKKLPKTTPAQ